MMRPTPTSVSRRGFIRLLLATFLIAPVPAWALSPLAPALSIEVDGAKINYTSTVKAPQHLTLVLIHGFDASLESCEVLHDPVLRFVSQRVPVEHAHRFKRDIRGSTLHILPQTRHMSPQGRPQQVIDFIEKFLTPLQ
jgi:hypothetical protein